MSAIYPFYQQLVLVSTRFMRNRKTGSVFINSKDSSYCTLCSNIKISRRTSDFINFILRLMMQLTCAILKSNFWRTAYWFSWVLSGDACSKTKCLWQGPKKKKINFNSQRAWYQYKSVNTITILYQDNFGSENILRGKYCIIHPT
jgi:hypothetical protein